MTIPTTVPSGSLSCLARTATLVLLLSLCGPAWSWSAGQSFEIEISDLEKGAPAAKKAPEKPGKSAKKTVPKRRVSPGPPTSRDLEGVFVTYTIRPGDHIYKVLTSRFGLSSERAEALIPRILRINGIRDIRGLQIGQTIRIPAVGKIAAASPPPAVAAPPATPATTPPVAAAIPTAGESVPAPSVAAPPVPSTAEAHAKPPQETAQPVAAAPSTPPKTSKAVLRTVSAGEATAVADALLDALSLKWSKAHPVTIPVGGSSGASLTIPVDRYFEDGGKRFFLDFGGADPDRATLVRLLELSGYRRIAIGPKDDFRAIAGKILPALEIPSEYRKHTLAPLSGGSGAVVVSGFLIIRAGERLFITAMPVDKKVSDLIQAGEWDIQ
jgi:hypothetical protein